MIPSENGNKGNKTYFTIQTPNLVYHRNMRTNPIEMLGQLQVHTTVYQMYKYCIVHNNIGDSSSLVLCVFGFLGAESLTWYWFSGLVGGGA